MVRLKFLVMRRDETYRIFKRRKLELSSCKKEVKMLKEVLLKKTYTKVQLWTKGWNLLAKKLKFDFRKRVVCIVHLKLKKSRREDRIFSEEASTYNFG